MERIDTENLDILLSTLISSQAFLEGLDSEAPDVPVEQSPAEAGHEAGGQGGEESHQVPLPRAQEAGAGGGGRHHDQAARQH